MGGLSDTTYLNDIWYSDDGVEWECATTSAPWSARANSTALVFNDKLWLIAGKEANNDEGLNDVWWTEDGTNWTRATESADWCTRLSNSALVFDNKMWVIGGIDFLEPTIDPLHDVWYSTDGINWTEDAAPTWSPRVYFGATVHDGRMWIAGGMNSSIQSLNDVWSTTFTGMEEEEYGSSSIAVHISPNPARFCTQASFITETGGSTTVTLHNLTGRVVDNVFSGNLPGGNHFFDISRCTSSNATLSAGIYYLKVSSQGEELTKSLIFVD